MEYCEGKYTIRAGSNIVCNECNHDRPADAPIGGDCIRENSSEIREAA